MRAGVVLLIGEAALWLLSRLAKTVLSHPITFQFTPDMIANELRKKFSAVQVSTIPKGDLDTSSGEGPLLFVPQRSNSIVEFGRFVRFGLVGLLNFFVYSAVTLISIEIFGLSPVIGSLIGQAISVAVTYIGHLSYSFKVEASRVDGFDQDESECKSHEGAVGFGQSCIDDEPVAILHHQMPHVAEFGLLAGTLAEQPGVGVGGRGMRSGFGPDAMKIALGGIETFFGVFLGAISDSLFGREQSASYQPVDEVTGA